LYVQDVFHDQDDQGPLILVHVVDPMSPTPLYEQLADLLAGAIERGDLEPRAVLPSESYLQQEHGLSRGTVRAAVRLLRERGLVVTLPQRGTFVADRS
jgi:GntR family transcriptional regulator